MNNQSLHDIIKSLPHTFVEKVTQRTSLDELVTMKKQTSCKRRLAVIRARIENITYTAT